MEFIEIHNKGLEAAKKATEEWIKENGEPFYCGFAWVNIYVDGRTPIGKQVKKVAEKNLAGKGYQVWNPSGHNTQCLPAKEAGAYAYEKVLRDHGIRAVAVSRLD